MKFSFIIPCYNVEKYLNECLESILQQTYQDWEMILIDGGSTDHTEEIIRNYSEKIIELGHIVKKIKGCLRRETKLLERW